MLQHLLLACIITTASKAPTPRPQCSIDANGYCTDRVMHYTLSFKDKDPAIRINTAIGIGTTIELPPNVKLRSKPDLSNHAMFSLGREKDWKDWQKRRVFDVLVKSPDKAPKDFNMKKLAGKPVRLELALDVGITLLVRLRIVAPEPEQSVVRLVLDFPELVEQEEWAQRRLKELVEQWQGEYEKRQESLDKEVAARVPYERAKAKLAHDECRELDESGEEDHVIAITEKICREGDTLEVHFRVINRGRHAFVIERVQVSPADKDATDYLLHHAADGEDGTTSRTVSLSFNESARGIVWWPLGDGGQVELQISEAIAKGRLVKIDKVKY